MKVDQIPRTERTDKNPTVYTFNDGLFRFCTASYERWCPGYRIVFRARDDIIAKDRAAEKGIVNYDILSPSTPEEANTWQISHHHFAYERDPDTTGYQRVHPPSSLYWITGDPAEDVAARRAWDGWRGLEGSDD